MLRHVGRNNPLVMVFSGLCCGILAMHQDAQGFMFGLALIALLVSRERIVHVLIGLFLGIAASVLGPSWQAVAEGSHEVSGVVSGTEYANGMFRAVLSDVAVDGRCIRGKALLNIFENQAGIGIGSRVSCPVKVRPPRRYGNKGEFDYKRYLLTRGIVLAGTVEDGTVVTVVAKPDFHGLKAGLTSFLDRYSRPEAELIKAMALGDRSGITPSLRDRFNALGIAHLMAISGLHIGIAMMIGYSVIFGMLRIVPPLALRVDVPFVSRLGGAGAALLYTIFVGPGVTVLRACIMALCCIAALLSLRKSGMISGLSIAGIVILIFWPTALYSASFQLSFSAVLGIGGVLEKTEGSPAWFKWLLITPAAGVFTAPLAVYLFGFVSSVGLLANSIVVPLFGMVIMPLSLMGIALYLLHPAACGQVFEFTMQALRCILIAGDRLGALHPVATPWISWVYLCYAGLIIVFWGARTRMRTIILAVIGAVLVVLPLMRHFMDSSSQMRFDFISVGQGDCSLITQGKHAVLIDAGPAHRLFDAGRFIVAPHLLRRGCTSLDLVVITHMHPDHYGGVPFILERFRVGQLWVNGRLPENAYFKDIMRIAKEKSIPLKYVCRGDRLRFGSMTMDVLLPLKRLQNLEGRGDQNVQSIVLMISDERTKGLFMGDADMFGELILTHLNDDIASDVLKVSHHGGKRSCLDPFLDAVRPDVAVISCGYGNAYGDPSHSAMKRLRSHGVRIYSTDRHGEVMVASRPGGTAVKSFWLAADNQ